MYVWKLTVNHNHIVRVEHCVIVEFVAVSVRVGIHGGHIINRYIYLPIWNKLHKHSFFELTLFNDTKHKVVQIQGSEGDIVVLKDDG